MSILEQLIRGFAHASAKYKKSILTIAIAKSRPSSGQRINLGR